jgi:hypothetical protein
MVYMFNYQVIKLLKELWILIIRIFFVKNKCKYFIVIFLFILHAFLFILEFNFSYYKINFYLSYYLLKEFNYHIIFIFINLSCKSNLVI